VDPLSSILTLYHTSYDNHNVISANLQNYYITINSPGGIFKVTSRINHIEPGFSLGMHVFLYRYK